MFIYSYFMHHGIKSPQKLVKALAEKGIEHACLIDEKGLGIPSFLKACTESNVKASFAIEISCFIEGEEEKQKGYLITGDEEGLKKIFTFIEMFHEQWIPYLKKEEIEQLTKKGVHLFLHRKKEWVHYITKESIVIEPVYFTTEKEKEKYEKLYEKKIGYSAEHSLKHQSFIEKISKDPRLFIQIVDMEKESVALEEKVDWHSFSKKEIQKIKYEIEYFKEKNKVMSMYSLHLAVKNGIEFIAHKDLYKSLLAYALGIIPKKPSYYGLCFDASEIFSFTIVIQPFMQQKLFSLLKNQMAVKYPFIKPALSPSKALKKASRLLKVDSQIAKKIKENETIEAFEKRMRIILLTNEEEQSVMQLAKTLTNTKDESCSIQRNGIIFVPKTSYVVQGEEIAYVDMEQLEMLSIPTLQFLYPPKNLNELPLKYPSIHPTGWKEEEIASFYLIASMKQ